MTKYRGGPQRTGRALLTHAQDAKAEIYNELAYRQGSILPSPDPWSSPRGHT